VPCRAARYFLRRTLATEAVQRVPDDPAKEKEKEMTTFAQYSILVRIGRTALATALALTWLCSPSTAFASQKDKRFQHPCTNSTLSGAYGLVATGSRPMPPPTGETFAAVGMRTYDGAGNFADTPGGINGSVTGFTPDPGASGTYQVNPDCTGVSHRFVPGLPFPIISAFVIVRDGDQVKEAVISPERSVVTVILDRR
jgi:hypothetical protein